MGICTCPCHAWVRSSLGLERREFDTLPRPDLTLPGALRKLEEVSVSRAGLVASPGQRVPARSARGRCQTLTDASRPLTFRAIGTVFVTDPEGNIVEFMQADRGVFAKYHS